VPSNRFGQQPSGAVPIRDHWLPTEYPSVRRSDAHSAQTTLVAMMRPWTARWGLAGMEEGIFLRYDARLRHSAARCRPRLGEISLHPSLAAAPRSAVASVLCHELAHIAAYHLYGAEVRPHGDEWAALVRTAGHEPSTGIRPTSLGIPAPGRTDKPAPTHRAYVHRCPVCQSSRLARRPVRAWRCAECVAAGLDGRLTITPRSQRVE
jgi:predicted SprT family Zn-dependent metalloprotease